MELKFFEYIGIAPFPQVAPLAFREALRLAPGEVRLRQRRAERVEAVNGIFGQILQFGRESGRYQGEERAELVQDDFRDFEGIEVSGEAFKDAEEFVFVAALGKLEGSLQRSVKTVASRVCCQCALRRSSIPAIVGRARSWPVKASRPSQRDAVCDSRSSAGGAK
ncbi:hypothetical protein N184_12285 [Sinorhizobium sp. GL28]|nr:hypothetical protein N184_12285 [Sinorhizobium sp. GL28]